MRSRTLRSKGWVLALPALAAALVHCSWSGLDSLGSGSPDSGSLAGDASPLFPADGGGAADTGTAPPVDAGSDAPADAAMPPPVKDAGPDAADAADAATPPPPSALPIYLDAGVASWCDQHPGYAFCADFDETALPAGFNASDGPFLIQTSSLPSSGPNDLLLHVPAQTGAGSFGSKLSRSFQTGATSVVLGFDFYPEVLNDTSAGILFAGLDFLGNANAKYSIRLAYNAGAPRLEESYLGSPSDVYHSNFTIATGGWSRIQVEITLPGAVDGGDADAGTATESIYVNGVLQGTSEVLTPPAGFDPRPNLLIGGVYGTSPTDGWALRYDNVTLDLH
jgi:hypothetical protein